MISHDGYLAMMVQSSMTWLHEKIKNITRYIHQLQIHFPARPDLGSVLHPTEWPLAHLTSILTWVLLMCNRDRSYYILLSMYVPSSPVSGFEQTITHFTNQSLWVSLEYNGDGSWILDGMLAQLQSLIIIHDGSYMKEISPDICSTATMIYCLITQYRCKCTWAERLASSGSYRRETLGRITTQLILNAASSSYKDTIPPIVVDCDNNGGLCPMAMHPSGPFRPTNPKLMSSACWNTLSWFSLSLSNWSMCNHMQKKQRNGKIVHWRSKSTISWIGSQKKALKVAHCTGQFIGGTFPYEQIWVTMGGKKVTGPLHLELEEFWGRSTARRFFNKKGIVLSACFDTVW